ncbi:MAG TPA: glycine cleavage system aminomethyltransferase GcvT [Candidatus Brocadiia bacterium]|nr:glycine cleavage system aminomethyltransferase GcvT [Candidatus Brocadiales bacterium]
MKKTPLYDAHVRLGARMVDFHGFLMPLQYTGIIEEHISVRNAAGIFDLSHMGNIEVRGKDALDYLQKLVTNDVGRLSDDGAIYTPICNERGGIIDDAVVYCLDKERFFLVVNCANTQKDLDWMTKRAEQGVKINNKSNETALIAIQGPQSESILKEITTTPQSPPSQGGDKGEVKHSITDGIAQLKRFKIGEFKINNTSVLISRTGYTGEDGFEIFLHPERAEKIWNLLLAVGQKYSLKPVGLGARDTLRLEAGFLLYSNDIDETTTPLEAGIGWTVKFDKGDFIGKEALLAQKIPLHPPLSKGGKGGLRKLIGFEMIDRGIPRQGNPIITLNSKLPTLNYIGKVTSGTYSPSTKKNIGLGYVEVDYSKIGTSIGVKIRDNVYKAVVVKIPFYRPPLNPLLHKEGKGRL